MVEQEKKETKKKEEETKIEPVSGAQELKQDSIIKDEKQELIDTLKRLQAEFENYKKRSTSEKALCIKQSSKHIVMKLLPIIDNFELALKNTKNHEEFVKGVELIFSQMFDILEAEGVKPIETQNKKFDHYYHEALIQSELPDVEDKVILEEFQKGYMLNDEVIRHSKVKVNKNDNKKHA